MKSIATCADSRGSSRNGQAMVEFVVGLIVILVVVAATLQLGWLGVVRSQEMNAARAEAGREALLPVPVWENPDFIYNREAGPDGVRYSKDDGETAGSVGAFVAGVVMPSHPAELGAFKPLNMFTALSQTYAPHHFFGLTRGRSTREVKLMPIVRDTLYKADFVEVEGEAWMTWTKGIY